VPNSIWDKPGQLTRSEFDRVELHPMLTEQMLRRSPALAALNPVACAHHEKCDGSGYHKRVQAADDQLGASVLAATAVYVGLTAERADRAPFAPDDAAAELRRHETGRLAVLVLEVAIAVLLLSWPSISRELVLRAIGASAVVIGLLEVAALSTTLASSRERWLGGAAGAAAFVFGVTFLAFPDRGFRALVTAVGLYLVTVGGLRLIRELEALLARRGSTPPRAEPPSAPAARP